MQAAWEGGDLLALLEGGGAAARAAHDALAAAFTAVREPWLARGLLHYHARTGSARALDLLARAPEPHAKHALDALADQLRAAERAPRRHALQALHQLLARRPGWTRLLLPPSPLPRDLLLAARRERDPVPQLSALLALAALLPAAPALAHQHAPELAEALCRAAPAPEPHLALGARALFLAAYAQAPCALLEALRAAADGVAGLEELARGVMLHPALLTGTRRAERAPDLLLDCRRAPPSPPAPAVAPPPPALDAPPAAPGSGAQAARSASSLRPGGEGWWSLGERSGAEAAPCTPLPEREPEPEPAVEATPENTPARLARQQFRFPPAESTAARAIGRTPPPGGAGGAGSAGAPDACAARLARVAAERRAQDSPVPIAAGAPPVAAARPQPRPAAALALDHDDRDEDHEVRELTARAGALGLWGAARRAPPAPPPGTPRPPRRAASCPPPGAARAHRATQTVRARPEGGDTPPAEPPEGARPESLARLADEDGAREPTERLDRYLAELYAGGAPAPPASELAERLALAHAQLMYERWRRDLHAERNRRLLGHERDVRALRLSNEALEDRVRALTRERDDLRARAARPPPSAEPPPCAEALERALAAERAARLRAEAALHASEGARARDAAELQRARGEGAEAARHVEALARAALAAERRAEHVRRLRRELLLLGEREARLAERVGAALEASAAREEAGGAQATGALRAALARAEAEAEEAEARSAAAGARAHELESALAAREAALKELKRSSRASQDEAAARLRALRDKYEALLRVVRAAAARDLERRAALPYAAPARLEPAAAPDDLDARVN